MKPIALLFGALMLASALLAPILASRAAAGPERPPDLESLVPAVMGNWRLNGVREAMTPATDESGGDGFGFERLLRRTYVDPQGERVMLLIGWSGRQSGALKPHRQEICYGAQGAEIRDLHRDRLALGAGFLEVTRLFAVAPARGEPVTYWLTLGDRVVNSPVSWLNAQLSLGLRGDAAQGLLVRVSSLSRTPERAYRLHDSLIAALLAHLPPSERWRFAGRQGA